MHERQKGMEGPGTYVIDEFYAAIFTWPRVLSDCSPVLWWSSHGEGMDAVRINCKKGATTENQGSAVTYMG